MKNIYKLLNITLACIITLSTTAYAENAVTEQLEQRKQSFLKKAPQEKIDDYEEGIRQVHKSGVLDQAKNTGDQAPDFTLPNALGEHVNLYSHLEKSNIVIIWYRGEWCPYCNIYLNDIQKHIDQFTALNAQIIAISPTKPDESWSAEDKAALKIHVLSDLNNKTAKTYGIAYTLPPKIAQYYQEAFDLHGVNEDDSNLLPLSASYIINQHGEITYAYLNADYRERAPTETLLQELRKLGK